MRNLSITGVLLLALLAIPACAQPPHVVSTYDLESGCNYSFKSSKAFSRLSTTEACMLHKTVGQGGDFYYSFVFADAGVLKGSGVYRNFSLDQGRPRLTLKSYADGTRGVEQRVVRTKRVSLTTVSIRSYTVVSQVSVSYIKQVDGALEEVEETYECWNNISYGKRTAVVASLCDIQNDPKRSMSERSWQADLIRSIRAR